MKHALLLPALCLVLLGCKKDDESKPDPNRPRKMVLTWTKEGSEPVRVKIERMVSALDPNVAETPINEDKTTSGSWEITVSPSDFYGRAIFTYNVSPSPGNRCHITVSQDGQNLEAQDVWIGNSVPTRTGGVQTLRKVSVSLNPESFR